MARHQKTPKWLQAARLRQGAPAADWLVRALGRAGVLPQHQAEEALRSGRIKLDGRVVREGLTPVTADSRVTLDGRDVSLVAVTRVLALHKPAGVVTAVSDTEKIGTVFDVLFQALPSELHSYTWHAVGRLDRDTTGLLLFTNDEQFVAYATSPDSHLPKTYVARVSGQVTEEKLKRLSTGVELDDGPTLPAEATQPEKNVVQLVLTEGRNHQVKRMLNVVGLPTLQLHREAVGSYAIDVPEGQVRELTETEIETRLRYVPRQRRREGAPEGA